MYKSVCVFIFAPWSPEEHDRSLDFEIQVIVNHPGGCCKLNCVRCKSSKHSYVWHHLSSLLKVFISTPSHIGKAASKLSL